MQTLAGADAIWDRMRLREPPGPAAAPAESLSAASRRETMKQERAAHRAAAVQNVLKTRAEAEALMGELESKRQGQAK